MTDRDVTTRLSDPDLAHGAEEMDARREAAFAGMADVHGSLHDRAEGADRRRPTTTAGPVTARRREPEAAAR